MSVPRTRSRRLPAVALVALLGSGVLAACGSDAEPGSAASPSASPSEADPSAEGSTGASPSQSPSEAGTVVELDLTGETPPPAESVRVTAGEPVTLAIDAAEAGELHVHSTPEQEIAYSEGASRHQLVLDRPGVVDVESHDLGVVLTRLEVR